MTVVNPLVPTNLFIQASSHAATTVEERQVDLRLQQMVRATVVEGGLDRALLEMEHRHYRAQSDIALQTGQKLTLQVLQTAPTLELRILHDPLGGKLNQLLPLLSRPYGWSGLLDLLRQQPLPQNLPRSTTEVYQQLQQLLRPDGQLPASLAKELSQLPGQLRQLAESVSGMRIDGESGILSPRSAQPYIYYRAESPPQADLLTLFQGLRQQLTIAQNTGRAAMPQAWSDETARLLGSLQQGQPLQQLTGPLANDLLGLLTRLQQRPNLSPQLAVGLDKIILQLTLVTARETSAVAPGGQRSPVNTQSTAGLPPPGQPAQGVIDSPSAQQSGAERTVLSQAASQAGRFGSLSGTYGPPAAMVSAPQEPIVPAEIGREMAQLLAHIQQDQGVGNRLSPELLGRLEGLLDRLRQLPAARSGQALLPNLEQLSSQLLQLVQQGPQRPEGGQLGVLSQLFGFHLEAELLKGKKKDALASLKLALLSLQDELGEEGKEPLRRLELFQLLKARLAEEQVQFLPLPFHELEEGYLLKEQQESEEHEQSPPLQLSMSLRLSALGSVRVDMLYDQQGLQLRLASEDKEKMDFLKEHSAELEESIVSVALRGLSFSDDAQLPARELLQRVLPEALGMLDTRI